MKIMKEHPQIIVILGQTATGKSDFAVQIAREIKGEIISADSRQVYTGMDLGTGKITKKEMRGVPHHLLDIAKPTKVFSASDFKKHAEKKIKEIIKRGNVPIVCGGTGFYIDTLLGSATLPEVPPNKILRAELMKKTASELFVLLQKLDPVRAQTIDAKNPVRLIRAIEIVKALGSVPVAPSREHKYEVLKIGLTLPDQILKEKIHARLLARIKKGMVREIKKLHDDGITWKRMSDLGLEYRYGALYLQKKISKDEMITKLNSEIWHYAKRQKTWFKRDKDIIWIDPREIHEQARVLKKIKDFIK
ncbi:MAG: tRNA (adenosine(37)-N6)-dimethylallyltransferase MiaA [Candidatus Pacebacteria bacterium]|nr:tRNA (adenosine(37)-N6)-dimethylallyltransferase MiaA [Candidatus Paceibacterota bacterium]